MAVHAIHRAATGIRSLAHTRAVWDRGLERLLAMVRMRNTLTELYVSFITCAMNFSLQLILSLVYSDLTDCVLQLWHVLPTRFQALQ